MILSITSYPKLRQTLNALKGPQFEKNIPFMYVDTVGEVTVGVGHDLDANEDMLGLPFIVKRFERHAVIGGDSGVPISSNRVVGRLATQGEIENDHDFLKRHPGLGKHMAEHLGRYTTLELSSHAIDLTFDKDLTIALSIARREFGRSFDDFPTTCQAALVDIAFNCGNFSGFQGRFVPAIKGLGIFAGKTMRERWKAASEACHRKQVSAERNALVAKWLYDGSLGS